jgi:serine-type anaerobic sulfatase-maturating enzyme
VTAATREFQVFAKPAGGRCNLACQYCYYLEKQALHPGDAPPRMPDDLLERYIVQHIDAAPGAVVAFSWHGGEPTVLGLDYFRRIVELQRKHQRSGRRVLNGMQTNGLLLDEAWARFLREERFRVGLSLDGPADLHDVYRVTRGEGPTHVAVMRAFALLRQHQIPCDILCVVHDRNVGHPTRVYRFFRKMGAQSLVFLPLVERLPGAEGAVSARTVSAAAYGSFLCTIFDEWVEHDTARMAVQVFDEATRPARGLNHSLCIFRETCGDVPVVEANGDFYCCDHFVDPAHRLGNIREIPLGALVDSPAQLAFGEAKRDTLPRYCRECDVRLMCHGGCPKDRFVQTPDGEAGLNYLCPAFKRFFTHILPFAIKSGSARLGDRLAGLPATAVVRGGFAGVGRNDPCPCGSGRKFKHCCLVRSSP